MIKLNYAVIEAARKAVDYDKITLILAATGIILAALGVMFALASTVLGAFAIFGYKDFKAMLREQNERMMKDFFAQYPTPQKLRDDIFDEVNADASAPIPVMEASAPAVDLVTESNAEYGAEAVAEPYPEEEEPVEPERHNGSVPASVAPAGPDNPEDSVGS